MAKFNKTQILVNVQNTGMIPVFYHKDQQVATNVLQACYNGGVRLFEFTNRGDFAHETFTQLVKYARKECPEMAVGAGSIVDPATAALYLQNGADFIVGPLFNKDVAKVCNRRLVPYVPGCGSVTEIGYAQEAGCDICKIFPAGSVGGPAFVKNLLAPMPWSMIMATGAVEPNEDNLAAWFKAGVACVGMGSLLFPKTAIDNQQWNNISQLCQQTLLIIQKYNTRL